MVYYTRWSQGASDIETLVSKSFAFGEDRASELHEVLEEVESGLGLPWRLNFKGSGSPGRNYNFSSLLGLKVTEIRNYFQIP